MRKNEIPKAKDNELITEYISKYASLLLNYNSKMGIKVLEKQCENLEAELLKREILTKEDIEKLRK